MTQTQAVRIERFCKGDRQQESETLSLNSQKVRDFYATKKESLNVPWPIHIPPSVDYLQIITINCDCQTVGSVNLFSDMEPVDCATIYPNGELYSLQDAQNNINNPRSDFFDKKETLELLAAENRELVVVTRGRQIKSFDRERDLILRQGEKDSGLWYNDTLRLKARALARA